MPTTQNTRAVPKNNTKAFGLLANGSCGPWEIAIDEALAGPDHWRAQIDGPTASLYFEVRSLYVVDKLCRFLESSSVTPNGSVQTSPQSGEALVVGKHGKTPVSLIKDDEYRDRVFLLVGPTDDLILRFVLAGKDLQQFGEALRQVKEDLDDRHS